MADSDLRAVVVVWRLGVSLLTGMCRHVANSRRLLSWGLLTLALLISGSSAAADPTVPRSTSPRSTFSERLDLVHVEVDLVVTDPKGRPVTDLDRTDVELYRDGARQEILSFAKPSDPGPASPSDLTAREFVPSARSRHLVVFVDNLRIWPKRRNALLRRLGDFIEGRIARGDRFSVVGFDGSLELFAVESRDTEKLLGSLKALESRPSEMGGIASQAHRLRRDLADGVEVSALQPRIERYVQRLRFDVARSAAGLAKTIEIVARSPAPISILYLSDGILAWPGDELTESSSLDFGPRIEFTIEVKNEPLTDGVPTPAVQYLVALPGSRPEMSPTAEVEGTGGFLEPLIRAANAHGVAFYPVRPSASLHPTIHQTRSRARGRADPIGPLLRLAESTGGDLVPYSRFEAALDELSRRLDSVYTLGFQTSPESDRASHTLEVQLARKGLKAHYRRAYAHAPLPIPATEH